MTPPPAREWDFGAPVRGYHWSAQRPVGRVLLQHGYGEYAERFVTRYSELIPQLVARGFDVFAFDMPGHGRSPGRRGSVDVRVAARHHFAATQALAQDGPVLLYGHSLGGLVTARTMVRNPAGVVGAVISSAALPLDTGLPLRIAAAVLSTLAPNLAVPLRAAPATTLARPAENAELIAVDPLMYGGRLTNLTASSSLAVAADVWRGASSWTAPALILHGTADRSTDPRGSRRLFGAISSTDKTLRLVKDGWHELLNDSGREQTLTTVIGWLSGRSVAS